MSNSKELKVKYHGNKDKKSKGRKKNPNVASVSKLGYRDDSPYRSLPYIDIHTPDGSIDMSGTGIPLWANGRILPPYSGIHRFDTDTVREIPLAQKGKQVKEQPKKEQPKSEKSLWDKLTSAESWPMTRSVFTTLFWPSPTFWNPMFQEGPQQIQRNKTGGLTKAQDGGDMPFGMPLKEVNPFTVAEYRQPMMGNFILPDPNRPELMNTGATEYKIGVDADGREIQIPTVVSGQYLGPRGAVERAFRAREAFLPMADPGSYSKFYDMVNKLGIMKQKKKGGWLKKYQTTGGVNLDALQMQEDLLTQQLKEMGVEEEPTIGEMKGDTVYPAPNQLPTVHVTDTLPERFRDQQKSQFIQNLGNLYTGPGYDLTVFDALGQGILGDTKYSMEGPDGEAPMYDPAELSENDAFRLYLGLNQNYGSFMPSKYEKGAYDLAEGFQKQFPEFLPKDKKKLQRYLDAADDDKIIGKNPFKPYGDFVMGRHQLKKGSDDKGDYIEYYDEWDLDTLGMAGALADKTVGTPFKIKGRVYYDKTTGKRMDEYAPKYEPELKYKKTGGLIKAQDGKEMRKRVKKMTKGMRYPVVPKSTLEVDDNLMFPVDESGVPIPFEYPVNQDVVENLYKFYKDDYEEDFLFMPPMMMRKGGPLTKYQIPPGEKKDINYYLNQARNQGTAVRDNTNAPNVPQRVKMQESIDQIEKDIVNLSEDDFTKKYGINQHGWQYKNRPAYKAKVDADIVAKRKQGIPEIKKEVKVNPNMMFMAPNATSAEQAQNVIDYNLGVIGAALPIPGLQSIKMSAPIAGTSRELPSILSMASKPERLIRNLPIGKRNQLAMLDHLSGLKKGMYDIKKGRPFFETFPITKAQKAHIIKLQDEARNEGEKFVFDYIYGPESLLASRDVVRNVHSDIYNKMSAFEPGYTFRMPQRDFALPSPNQLDDLNFSSSNIMIGHLGENRPRLVSPRRSAMMREVSQDPALSKHADYFKSYLDNDRSTSLGWNTTNDYGPNVTLRGNGFYYRTPRDIAETVVHETGHTFQKMGSYGHPLWGGKNSIGKMIAIDDQNITPYRFANTNTPIGSRLELAMVEPKKWEDDLVKIEKKYFPNDDYDLKWQEAYVNQSLSLDEMKQFKSTEKQMLRAKNKFKSTNENEYYTWEASPLELHSETMVSRYRAFKQLKKQFNLTDEEALNIIRSGSLDDVTGRQFMNNGKIDTFTSSPNMLENYLIKSNNLNRFFKATTSDQEKYDLIRMLPAIGGLGLAGSLYQSPYEKEGLQRQKKGGPQKTRGSSGWLQKYQTKGNVRYVEDLNDPALKAFQDSSSLYNAAKKAYDFAKDKDYIDDLHRYNRLVVAGVANSTQKPERSDYLTIEEARKSKWGEEKDFSRAKLQREKSPLDGTTNTFLYTDTTDPYDYGTWVDYNNPGSTLAVYARNFNNPIKPTHVIWGEGLQDVLYKKPVLTVKYDPSRAPINPMPMRGFETEEVQLAQLDPNAAVYKDMPFRVNEIYDDPKDQYSRTYEIKNEKGKWIKTSQAQYDQVKKNWLSKNKKQTGGSLTAEDFFYDDPANPTSTPIYVDNKVDPRYVQYSYFMNNVVPERMAYINKNPDGKPSRPFEVLPFAEYLPVLKTQIGSAANDKLFDDIANMKLNLYINESYPMISRPQEVIYDPSKVPGFREKRNYPGGDIGAVTYEIRTDKDKWERTSQAQYDKVRKDWEAKQTKKTGGPLTKHQVPPGEVAPFVTSNLNEYNRRKAAYADSANVHNLQNQYNAEYLSNFNTTAIPNNKSIDLQKILELAKSQATIDNAKRTVKELLSLKFPEPVGSMRVMDPSMGRYVAHFNRIEGPRIKPGFVTLNKDANKDNLADLISDDTEDYKRGSKQKKLDSNTVVTSDYIMRPPSSGIFYNDPGLISYGFPHKSVVHPTINPTSYIKFHQRIPNPTGSTEPAGLFDPSSMLYDANAAVNVTLPYFAMPVQEVIYEPKPQPSTDSSKPAPMKLMTPKGIMSIDVPDVSPQLITEWNGPTEQAPFVDYEAMRRFTAAGGLMIDTDRTSPTYRQTIRVPKGYIEGSKEEKEYRSKHTKKTGGPHELPAHLPEAYKKGGWLNKYKK